jgi:hypothetical protein
VFVDVISVSAVLYIINLANCNEIVVSGRLGTFYNFFGKYTKKIIGVSGNLRTLHNSFLLCKG